MKRMKKIKWCKLIYQFRHCLAFMTVIVVLFICGIDSFADTWGSGSYLSDNIATYYGGQDTTAPIFHTQEMTSVFTENGFPVVQDFVNYLGLYNTSTTLDLFPDYFHWLNEADIDNVHYEGYVGMPIVCLARSAYQFQYMNYYFIGTTNPCIVVDLSGQWYVFSETDFSIVTHLSSPYSEYRNNDVTTTMNSNGLYYKVINAFGGNYPFYYDFTNMPIYVISQDGSTGVSSLASFSYDGESGNPLFNFNYLFTDGDYVDPNAPPEVESDVKYNLTFRDNTYYSGSGLNLFWHNNNFTFTEYQLNNPTYYRLKFKYRVEFANNLGVNDTYTYEPDSDVQLAYFLGQANRLNTGSRISVPLCSDWFLNSNGQRLTTAIISTINAVTGTDVQYINPNGIFENIMDWAVSDYNYFWGIKDGSDLQAVIPRYDGVITKFNIYAEVSLYNEVNSNYESYPYIDSHDFLSGKGNVVSTDNTVAPYEDSPVPVYTQLPSDGNGGVSAGANSAVAIIEKGANQITVYGGSSQGGFMMPQQDWNAFGGLLQEMKTGLTTVSTDNGVMSAMQVVQNVTSGILPTSGNGTTNKLWILIYAGVAGSVVIALWNKAAHNH